MHPTYGSGTLFLQPARQKALFYRYALPIQRCAQFYDRGWRGVIWEPLLGLKTRILWIFAQAKHHIKLVGPVVSRGGRRSVCSFICLPAVILHNYTLSNQKMRERDREREREREPASWQQNGSLFLFDRCLLKLRLKASWHHFKFLEYKAFIFENSKKSSWFLEGFWENNIGRTRSFFLQLNDEI